MQNDLIADLQADHRSESTYLGRLARLAAGNKMFSLERVLAALAEVPRSLLAARAKEDPRLDSLLRRYGLLDDAQPPGTAASAAAPRLMPQPKARPDIDDNRASVDELSQFECGAREASLLFKPPQPKARPDIDDNRASVDELSQFECGAREASLLFKPPQPKARPDIDDNRASVDDLSPFACGVREASLLFKPQPKARPDIDDNRASVDELSQFECGAREASLLFKAPQPKARPLHR